MSNLRRTLKALLFVLLCALTAQASAGQVVNGDFSDATQFGNDTGWNQSGDATRFTYFSPGQTGAGSGLLMKADNQYPLSQITQDVAISSGSNVPFLDFWYSAQDGDGDVSGGGQRVQVLNTSNVVLSTPLDISQNNSFGWVHVMTNLSAYAGQTVRLAFMARGQISPPHGGTLYLDSISINYATYTPTATPSRTITQTFTPTASPSRTPSFTVSPTPTPTPSITTTFTVTMTPTSTPPPSQIQNGNFDGGFASWIADPGTTRIFIYSGSSAPSGGQYAEVSSYSGFNYYALQQVVHIDNIGAPQLIFWYKAKDGAGDTSQSYAFADIRKPDNTLLQRIVQASRRDTSWNQVTYDLGAYVGQDIEFCFGAAVPGSQPATIDMDDISIYYGTPTVTPSVTPSFTATPTVTPSYTITPTATLSATISPSFTVSPTFTATPPFLSSQLGHNVAGPVPAKADTDICVYFQRQPSQSQWKIYNLIGQQVAQLHFDAEYSQCWHHNRIAPGIYFLRLQTEFVDGTAETDMQKLALVP